jgi:hypothetical protein
MLSMSDKTAVLIHGRHLQTQDWEKIVWGLDDHSLGQVPVGILMAIQFQADLIYWGTGASQKQNLLESEYTYQYTLNRLAELEKIVADQSKSEFPVSLSDYLQKVSFLDTQTQDTASEITHALEVCVARGIKRLILVSSPSHIARCHQEALKQKIKHNLDLTILATASSICFADSEVSDVVIVEPPHRGDMPLWQTYKYVRSIFIIMRQSNEIFEDFLNEFGQLLKKFHVDVTWRPKK